VKVDSKGRLTIPSNLLTSLSSASEFFITSEDGKSARIYPMKVWSGVEKQLIAAHRPESDRLLVRAKYFGQAVTIDKQGRVLIPVILRRTARIKGEVNVFGYSKYLDVWDHGKFVKNLKRSSVTTRDEKTLRRLLDQSGH
jgi:MraZ protein